jgi:hypothetical protein
LVIHTICYLISYTVWLPRLYSAIVLSPLLRVFCLLFIVKTCSKLTT